MSTQLTLAEALGMTVRELRESRRLTGARISDKLDCAGSTVNRLEHAQYPWTLDWIERFAEVFDMTPVQLLAYAEIRQRRVR